MELQLTQSINTLIELLTQDTDAPGDLDSALQQIVQSAHQLFGADLCTIFAINPLTQRFLGVPISVGSSSQPLAATLNLSHADGLAHAILDQRVLFAMDLHGLPDSVRHFAAQAAIVSLVGLALYTRRHAKPLAVLAIGFRTPQTFGDQQRAMLQLFGRQAASVLQATWFLRRYGKVVRIGQEINQGLENAQTLFEKLHAHVAEIIDTRYFLMLLVYHPQTDRRDLYMVEEGAYREQRDGVLAAASRWVIQHRQRLVIRHLAEEQDRLPAHLADIPNTKTDEQSLIFLPLVLRDVPLGVLSVQHPQPNVYDEEDVRLLELLGNHVALALSNIHLYASLHHLNETGQFLTRQLDSQQVLQGVVQQIRATTHADVVTLYPYDQSQQHFKLPAWSDGALLQPGFPLQSVVRSDDIISLVIQRTSALFARDSTQLYALLGGDVIPRHGDFERREQIHSTAALPLLVGAEPVGALFVNFRNPQRFDAPQKILIEGLANYAAIAIKNARAFSSLLYQRLNELELLQRIQRAISHTLDLDVLLHTILELATERVHADAASILLYNSHTKCLETRAAIGTNAESSRTQIIPLDQAHGLTRAAFLQQLPLMVANVGTDPDWRDVYLAVTPNIQSELAVPLLDGTASLGILNLESVTAAAFTQADQDFLVTLAMQAVAAIKNAQAYEREKRTVDELMATRTIGREIIGQLDPNRVLETILDHALTITRSTTGHIMLYDPTRDDLYNVVARGVLPDKVHSRLARGQGVVWQAMAQGHLINVNIGEPPWSTIYQEFFAPAGWELAVPLLEQGVARGVINIESPIENPFTERDERLLTALADLALIALQNAERYQKAEERQRRLAALHEIDLTIINQLGDPDQVMQIILQNAQQLTNAEIADLDVYEHERISTTYSTRLDDQAHAAPWRVREMDPAGAQTLGIMRYVATTRQSYRTLGDAQQDPYYFGDAEVHSEIAVPLFSATDRLIGVLNVESRRAYAFDDDDMEILELFAGQAVIAIKNARMYARAEQELLRFRLLHQAGRELGEIADLNQLKRAYAIVTSIAYTASRSQVIIRRYDPDRQELHVVRAIEGYSIPPVPLIHLDQGVNGRVARERSTVVVPDVDDLAIDMPVMRSLPPERSLVVLPIQFRGEYYGNLALLHEDANHFLDVDVELFEGLSTQLGLTIHRLETAHAQQEAEQRIREAETMSSIGQAGFELAHRLGNDLGPVRSVINQLKRELARMGVEHAGITGRLDQITRDVGKVLSLSSELKHGLGSLRDELTEPRETTDIAIRELLWDTAQSMPQLSAAISVVIDIADDVQTAHGSHKQIADILRNLFVNAIEAMPRGGTITLRARNAGNAVLIDVEDSGMGIAPAQALKIFALFYSTKGSSGFGLWSARRNALANGGELRVRSQLGQGSTFTLSLPITAVQGRNQL